MCVVVTNALALPLLLTLDHRPSQSGVSDDSAQNRCGPLALCQYPFLQSSKFGLLVLAWAESTVYATGAGELMGRIVRPACECDATCNLTIFLMLRNILLLF